MSDFSKIKFGDGFTVTDEGAGVLVTDDPANDRSIITIPGGSYTGIQFNTVNSGGWLRIETTGNYFTGYVNIGIKLQTADTGQMFLDAHKDLLIRSYKGLTIESLGRAAGVSDDAHMYFSSARSIVFNMYPDSAPATVTSFKVMKNGGASGGTLLEVRSDGTYHIKAGKTWVADL